jgi:hypothetical protein
MALFKRFRNSAAADEAAVGERLGSEWIAVRREASSMAPAQCVTLVYGEAGTSRRLVSFRSDGGAVKIACMKGERAWCFHPGPYVADVVPFAAAPEIGLRMVFVIDAADPRVTQQRFDLYLVSEQEDGIAQLTLESFGAQAQAALRGALEQGVLDLPPCTSLEEWNLFRAGLNELMYTRFGVTVEDCVPVDLGDTTDFAAMLRSRAAAADEIYAGVPAVTASDTAQAVHPAAQAWPTPTAAPFAPPTTTAQASPPLTTPPSSNPTALPPLTSPMPGTPPAPTAPASAPLRESATSNAWPTSAGSAASSASGNSFVRDESEAPHARSSDTQLPAGWNSPTGSRAAQRDALAIRRLFLELPALSAALRQIALPEGQETFRQQQAVLQRLSLLALDAGTMPSLDWTAPDRKTGKDQRAERADQSRRAAAALDEAWSLLAGLKHAGPDDAAACLQDADRIVANLEYHLRRRAASVPQPDAQATRVEPKL